MTAHELLSDPGMFCWIRALSQRLGTLIHRSSFLGPLKMSEPACASSAPQSPPSRLSCLVPITQLRY